MTPMVRQGSKKAGPLMLALLVLNLLLGLLPSGVQIDGIARAQTGQGTGPPWFEQAFEYRVELTVDPSSFNFELVNHPAEVDLNFSAMVGTSGFKMDMTSLELVEYRLFDDWTYSISNPTVAFRFYRAAHFDPSRNAAGTIAWVLSGRTDGPRYFYLYFSGEPSNGPGMGLPLSDDQKSLGMIDSNYWIQRGMVFYGFDPGEQAGWANVDEAEVIGLYNHSTVKVYNITDQALPPSLMNSTILDRGVLWRYPLPDGDYFKIVSDKPVVASVSSAMSGGGSAKTYYPSADRNIVGRDFLMSPYNMTSWHGQNYALQVYAVEDARVSIYDMAGNHIKELDVPHDNHSALSGLKTGTVYHIVSNGDIMIEQEAINAFSVLPSATGAPVGHKFFGSIQDFDGSLIEVIPYERANVTITDMDYGDLIATYGLGPYGSVTNDLTKGGRFKIESTGNISVLMGSTEGGAKPENLGDDVSFVGGPGARWLQGFGIINPGPGSQDQQYPGPYTGSVLFSFFNDTHVMADGVSMTLKADQYLTILPSNLASSRPLSFMTLGRGYTDKEAQHRWNDWGSYLAGGLLSPKVTVGPLERVSFGIDLYPSPSEGAINDTMVHAVEPGRSTVFRISVKDLGMYPENVALSKGTSPTGWTASLNTTSVDLQVGRPVEVLLTVSVPSNALKDTQVNISVRGDTARQGAKARNDTVFAEVLVDPFYYPDLEGEFLKYVDPGGTAIFNITLTNLGNAHDDIMVSLEGPGASDWSVSVEPIMASLDPLTNITIHLKVTAPKNAVAGDRLIMDLRAKSGTWSNRTDVHRTTTIVRQFYDFNATAPPLIDILPGSTGISNISITNLGNGHDIFSIITTGSGNGWTLQVPGTVEADRYKRVDAKLVLVVPGKDPKTGSWSEAPGNRTVGINVTDAVGIKKSLVVTIRVLQVFGVSLKATEDMLQIRSTQKATFILTVYNTGNGNDTYSLNTSVKGAFERTKLSLRPGASETVNLTVGPQPNKQRYVVFDVTATSAGNATDSTALTLRVIYPSAHSYIGDYTCLWIVLVAVCIFVSVKLAQRRLAKKKV